MPTSTSTQNVFVSIRTKPNHSQCIRYTFSFPNKHLISLSRFPFNPMCLLLCYLISFFYPGIEMAEYISQVSRIDWTRENWLSTILIVNWINSISLISRPVLIVFGISRMQQTITDFGQMRKQRCPHKYHSTRAQTCFYEMVSFAYVHHYTLKTFPFYAEGRQQRIRAFCTCFALVRIIQDIRIEIGLMHNQIQK